MKTNFILVAGGAVDYYATNNCFLFNIETSLMKDVGNVITKRHGHVVVNLKDIIYAIGGRNKKREFLNMIETFHQSTEKWETLNTRLHVT